MPNELSNGPRSWNMGQEPVMGLICPYLCRFYGYSKSNTILGKTIRLH